MDVVTLQSAKADATSRNFATRSRQIGGGHVVVADRNNGFTLNNLSNGTDTGVTSRFAHLILTSCYDLRLLYSNYNAGADGPNDITVKATVEPPSGIQASTVATAVYPVTFSGKSTVTIQPGGWALSDPIPLTALAGQYVYTRTFVSVSAGNKWPTGAYVGSLPVSRTEGKVANTDLTAAGGSIPQSFGSTYTPSAILGVPSKGSTDPRTWIGVGDSIIFGSGDSYQDQGFLNRQGIAQSVAVINVGKPSENAFDFQTTGQRQRLPLAALATYALEEYARNDLNAAKTLAQIQVSVIAIWTALYARRLRVYRTTVMPSTTTTDGWTSTAGQTAVASEAVRLTINAWLRDGAPMHLSAGVWTADPTGTTGASIARCAVYDSTATLVTAASGPAHLLSGVVEVADLVESARNSGLFKAPDRVVTDAAITTGTATLTSATANFTSADLGLTVNVVGAGAAGAVLSHVITAVTNSTTVTLGTNAGTTVSGARAGIGSYTADGTHPSTTGHIRLQPAIPLTTLP